MGYLEIKHQIKEELRRNLEQLTEHPSKAEDLVAEISEDFAPVYNGNIIREWVELPAEYSDRWKEYGYDANRNEGGIVQLMAIDLVFYYLEIGQEVWAELQIEIGEIQECPRHEGSFDCSPFCEVCEGEQHYKVSDTLPCVAPNCGEQITKDIWLEEMGFCVEHSHAYFDHKLDPLTIEPLSESKKESK